MPKIVLSMDETTWVGKELYPEQRYIGFDEIRFEIPKSDIILEPTQEDIIDSIETYFGMKVNVGFILFQEFVWFLTQPKYTNNHCAYFKNHKSKFGVSKCLNPNIEYVVK